jgi:hypothetical protein
VVGVYIPPSDHELVTLEYLVQALDSVTPGLKPIVMGDLNVGLNSPRNEWQAEISTELLGRGLEDMLPHLKKRWRDVTLTWHQQRGDSVEERQSRCDYILSPNRKWFTKVAIRDSRSEAFYLRPSDGCG